ncbi:membrane protein insertion efficiency factor YidD [bacterium]|nr:membrane protein insertion efficiency factor YidD [bacterium]
MPRRRWPRTLTLVIILLLAAPGYIPAGDRMQGPYSQTRRKNVTVDPPTSTVKWIGKGAIRLYSETISPADGPRSPSYPTSTAYGREAIETHGFLVGILLIADRLIHEADVPRGPRIILYGTSRYDNPVKANTYWWDGQLDQD